MQLQTLFKRYNKKYFRDLLPHPIRVLQTQVEDDDINGRWDAASKTILLSAKLKGLELRRTLIHEMAHAAAPGDGHGYRFRFVLFRAYRLGAPVDRSRLHHWWPEEWAYMDDSEIEPNLDKPW